MRRSSVELFSVYKSPQYHLRYPGTNPVDPVFREFQRPTKQFQEGYFGLEVYSQARARSSRGEELFERHFRWVRVDSKWH